MKTPHKKFILVGACLLSACGMPSASEGFFSDANICRPIEPIEEDVSTDILSGKVAIPAPTAGAIKSAQLSPVEAQKRNVWGVDLYLSSAQSSETSLKLTALIKRKNAVITDILTVGPDGGVATQVFWSGVQSATVSTDPAWVRTQFPGSFEVAEGDATWLIAEPNFDGDELVNWWYRSGEGAYVTTAGSPVFIGIPGVETVYKLIYCE